MDTAAVEKLLGARGSQSGDAFTIAVARNDLKVKVAGARATAALGAKHSFVFRAGALDAELVLLEDQTMPALTAALEAGLEIISLGNRFLWDSPRLLSLRLSGRGDESKLARAAATVMRVKGGSVPRADVDPASTTPDPQIIQEALGGLRGAMAANVFTVAFPGFGWAAFAGSDESAVVSGELTVSPGPLGGVLRALIPTIHPVGIASDRVHFWGAGATDALGGALKKALAVK